MKVINTKLNQYFAVEQRKAYRGIATGSARIILGIIQAALNSIASLLLAIPYKMGKLDKFNFKEIQLDAEKGLLHVFRGLSEFFSTQDRCYSDFWPYGHLSGYRRLVDDDPFEYEIVPCPSYANKSHDEEVVRCRLRTLHSSKEKHYILDPVTDGGEKNRDDIPLLIYGASASLL